MAIFNAARCGSLPRALRYSVILAIVSASLILSVGGIKCHQCNSHLDEDCIQLRLNTPRAPRDDQYLRECEGDGSTVAFCRKTVITIEVTREHRIIRGCGWVPAETTGRNNTCFDADNEGYLETICACHEDGCNAAPSRRSSSLATIAAVVAAFAGLLWRYSV